MSDTTTQQSIGAYARQKRAKYENAIGRIVAKLDKGGFGGVKESIIMYKIHKAGYFDDVLIKAIIAEGSFTQF